MHTGVPGLDGVIALTHDLGLWGMAEGSRGRRHPARRTLRGYAGHANIVADLDESAPRLRMQPPRDVSAGTARRNAQHSRLVGTRRHRQPALRIADMVFRRRDLGAASPSVSPNWCWGGIAGGSDAYRV